MVTEIDEIRDTTNVDVKVLYDIIGKFESLFGNSINIANVVDAATELMKLVGNIKKLSGKNKKFIVTKMLIFLVKESNFGTLDETMDKIFINVIPITIDKLILVEHGKLKFNKSFFDVFVKCFRVRT